MISQKVGKAVTPAKAGVQNSLNSLDSRFRGNDENGTKKTFYEAVKIAKWKMPISREKAHHFDFYNLKFAFCIEAWPIFQRAKLLRHCERSAAI